jgi:hypothetical protein
MHRTYPVRVPIETSHGRGETREVGPTRITFATTASFTTGEELRFAISLRGSRTPVDVVGSGRVEAVKPEGELYVVDASIEQTHITLAASEGDKR